MIESPTLTPIDLLSHHEERLSAYNLESINYLIEGMSKGKTVNLAELVNYVDYEYESQSLYEKFQYFFRK